MKIPETSPFYLDNDKRYQQWREQKLAQASTQQNYPVIKLKNTPPHFFHDKSITRLSNDIHEIHSHPPIHRIIDECDRNNYCFYSIDIFDKAPTEHLNKDDAKKLIHQLAKSCGIQQLDNHLCAEKNKLTSILNKANTNKRAYIPYTKKPLSWHTDGYYNSADNTIRSMLLHCYENAAVGGESAFMDHDIVYILLRDQNPNWIKALSHPQVMTIPANIVEDRVIRSEQSGPVFSLSPQGRLHMRYSARKHHIIWHQNKDTQDALSYLRHLLNYNTIHEHSDYIIKHKLKAGEGIMTRNILHCRKAFEDDGSKAQRLLFRGRFNDELPHVNELNTLGKSHAVIK